MSFIDHAFTQRANRKFIQRAMKAPLLDAEREVKLALGWRDSRDPRALEELTTAYLRLCIAVASRFRNYGLPFGDLIQEGVIGLMQAADRFDPAREVRFSTYATWWIRAAIQDFVLKNWSIVRLTSTATQKSLFFNLRRLRQRIENKPSQALSRQGAEKIAELLKVNVRDVEDMDARLTGGDRSLNAAPGEDTDTEWQDSLTDDRPLPEETTMAHRDGDKRRRWLDAALKVLSVREFSIIKARRLQDIGETLESIGGKLGISKERVRQIEANALLKLRRALDAQCSDPVGAGLIGA